MSDEEYLLLSGVQHFVFCRRQWALIHIEKQWAENFLTAEGRVMHQNAHEGPTEKRGGTIISRGMPVVSHELKIQGVCDVVEFQKDEKGITLHRRKGKYQPYPVEYKRGKPKQDDSDAMQLCAQALCLEEMLCCSIEYGYLYYGESRRREQIFFDHELREKVGRAFEEMYKLYSRKHTPKVKKNKRCRSCSMADICLPKLEKTMKVSEYIRTALGEDEK